MREVYVGWCLRRLCPPTLLVEGFVQYFSLPPFFYSCPVVSHLWAWCCQAALPDTAQPGPLVPPRGAPPLRAPVPAVGAARSR